MTTHKITPGCTVPFPSWVYHPAHGEWVGWVAWPTADIHGKGYTHYSTSTEKPEGAPEEGEFGPVTAAELGEPTAIKGPVMLVPPPASRPDVREGKGEWSVCPCCGNSDATPTPPSKDALLAALNRAEEAESKLNEKEQELIALKREHPQRIEAAARELAEYAHPLRSLDPKHCLDPEEASEANKEIAEDRVDTASSFAAILSRHFPAPADKEGEK